MNTYDVVYVVIFITTLVAIGIIHSIAVDCGIKKIHKDKEEFTPEQMKRFEEACCGDNPPKEK